MSRRAPFITSDKLREEYITNGLSQRDIAYKYGVTQTAVEDYMRQYGIPARIHGPSRADRERVIALRHAGYSYRMIAHHTGLSETMVYTAIKGAGLLFKPIPTLHKKPYAGEYPDAEPMVG